MPALSNARHEIFAQYVASGKELGEAYVAAGFKPNKGNPTTLKKKKDVESRITELLEERAGIVTSKIKAEVEQSRERILRELDDALALAKRLEMPGPMWQAAMAKAKILGHIIDRREVGEVGAFDALTDEELVSEAAKKARELGVAGPRAVDDTD